MPIQNPERVVTKQDLRDFYDGIYDYLGGGGSGGGSQVDTMPTADAEHEGKIVQYVGSDETTYTNGLFYKCEEITPSTDPKTYQWVGTPVMSAGDGISIDDGEISTDNMQSGDMADVVTPLPSIPTRGIKYSTDEQVIGEWIDGKPLYQKTFSCTIPNGVNVEQDVEIDVSSLNVKYGIKLEGFNIANSTISVGISGYMNPTPNNILMLWFNKSTNKVILRRKADSSTGLGGGSTAYITFQYTKTTD